MQGPQGEQGATGPQGNTGSDGPQGPQGPQGNNGADGRNVSNIYDDGSGRAVIQMSDGGTYGPFTVASGPQGMPGPQGNNGNDGAQGPQGYNGSDGAQGPQGPQGNPGEVSSMDLSTALGGTSANSNAISQLGLTVSDPPTQSEMQTIANKLDELIAALRR